MPPVRRRNTSNSVTAQERRGSDSNNPYLGQVFGSNTAHMGAGQECNLWFGELPQLYQMVLAPFLMASPQCLYPSTAVGWNYVRYLVPWPPAFGPTLVPPPRFSRPMPTPVTATPDSQISYDDTSVALQDVSRSASLQCREDPDQQDKDREIDAFAQQRSKPSKFLKAWDEMYQPLLEFKNKHGSCLVPTHYVEDPKLGRWVTNQRYRRRREPLTEERKQLLDSIGFVWRVKKRPKLQVMFKRLVKYKAKHGNCRVPQKYKKDPPLGEWVQTQRREKTHCGNRTFAERREKLNAIGFEWCPEKVVWEEMFERLVTYKAEYGNCLVRRNFRKDPKLGRWVEQQRIRNKKGGLPPKRKEQLDSIGFVWSREVG